MPLGEIALHTPKTGLPKMFLLLLLLLLRAGLGLPRAHDDACTACTKLLHSFLEFIKDDHELLQIMSGNVCRLISEYDPEECVSFLTGEAEAFFARVSGGFTSQELCAAMFACPFDDHVPATQCATCGMFAEFLEIVFMNNHVLMNLASSFSTLCIFTPIAYQPLCVTFVKNNFQFVFSKLLESFPPRRLCILAKACK